MYLPPHFKEDRLEVLAELVRQHPFAVLVTLGAQGLVANHVPMLLDPQPAPWGTLRAHVARANPVWSTTRPEVEALAIFQGPHHYISPSWYPTKRETGMVVPTWNYAVVHARGLLRPVDDADWLRSHVTALTRHMESGFAAPWSVTDAPADFIEKMLKGIVGIEIRLTGMEGKWKVSQNRTEPDRHGVVAALREEEDAQSQAMARLVEQRLPPR